jgi:hypothetical protein
MVRVLSDEFNEQVKRTVRESIRRERNNTGKAGRWHKKGGGGVETRYWAVLIDDLPADPGIYPTGSITSGTSSLTTSLTLSSYVDTYTVIVCGAGDNGGNLLTTINSASGSTVTLGSTAQTTVTDADIVVLAVADAWILERNSCGRLVKSLQYGTPRMEAVVNRFRHIELLADTLIGIEWQEGEWTPYKADCDSSTWQWIDESQY